MIEVTKKLFHTPLIMKILRYYESFHCTSMVLMNSIEDVEITQLYPNLGFFLLEHLVDLLRSHSFLKYFEIIKKEKKGMFGFMHEIYVWE